VYARALDEAEPAPALDVHRYAQRVRMAAHELQQPLNAIGLFAEVVARAGADERPGAMARLLANVRKMARAVEDFRDVALSEAGSLALHRVPTDLAALVTGVLARASTPDVRYSLQRRRAVPRMSLDADRIERALHALFAFAGAHGAGREVVLDRVATEARVAIACATVPPEDHDDPRLHLCRAIAAAHGGRIVIDAGDPAGTSLQILLPIDVGRIP
jgi:signal transduction histidine kinase